MGLDLSAGRERKLLARKLKRALKGEVLFDDFSRGRYSTDASVYQIMPLGVVVARDRDDVQATMQVCAEAGVAVLPRGAGTSQCGQTVGEAVVVDVSKHLDEVLALDLDARRVTVGPGLVLDRLNRYLKPHGLFFPIDPSTANRATLGGMAGNNSCGARSLVYGNMVHNVHAIEAILPDGRVSRFGPVQAAAPGDDGLLERLRAIRSREDSEIRARFPDLLRRVGGYNLDQISDGPFNTARVLVGSEGTLAFFTRLELDLQPLPRHKVLGVCHFPTLHAAMEHTRHIVGLQPTAVELVDRTMIDLARDNAVYRPIVAEFLKGEPDALLLVEFAGDDPQALKRRLRDLDALLADYGLPHAVVAIEDGALQAQVWEVRKAGLNIMMSMKGDGKPVSFIEDCAVPLEHLAEYTDRLTRIFAKHGTQGTWYAHASVGCLHVRPVLNMKTDGAAKMRAIAEEAFALVQAYKGSHSGEHGDGLVRSEWHEKLFGPRLVKAFEDVKDAFDPHGLMNPGKIVRAPRMDDRRLFRYGPDYRIEAPASVLDWSAWGGFGAAVEMCNNNGACRKFDAGVMCPSFRATRDEQHLTRGRANTLRLALSGQLGADALTSDALYDTMALCVGCKGCKRECPTGVDMARMKTEFLYHYRKRHGLGLRERAVAYLPRYAPVASRFAPLLNLRDRLPGLAGLSERVAGLSARRTLPKWRRPWHRRAPPASGDGKRVALFADTFTNYFEPDNAAAAHAVLTAAGYRVELAGGGQGRPLCCGRTFLAEGLVDEARAEARRLLAALTPYAQQGVPVVGLEPSCLLTLRDELGAMLPGAEADAVGRQAKLFEEFLAEEHTAGALALELAPLRSRRALLHGHCHQKAFDTMAAVSSALRLIPELEVAAAQTGCCGMAGAFGYHREHYDASMAIARLDVLPAVERAGPQDLIVADGFSCRHQIFDGSGRRAQHVAQVLASALSAAKTENAA